jgi:hypothetical protein
MRLLLPLSQVRSSDPGARLELRFRPEDPYCHPAFGQSRASTGLLLRLSKRKGAAAPCAEMVARVRTAYHFEGKCPMRPCPMPQSAKCLMKCLVCSPYGLVDVLEVCMLELGTFKSHGLGWSSRMMGGL